MLGGVNLSWRIRVELTNVAIPVLELSIEHSTFSVLGMDEVFGDAKESWACRADPWTV